MDQFFVVQPTQAIGQFVEGDFQDRPEVQLTFLKEMFDVKSTTVAFDEGVVQVPNEILDAFIDGFVNAEFNLVPLGWHDFDRSGS
jgi:hypothetical protein